MFLFEFLELAHVGHDISSPTPPPPEAISKAREPSPSSREELLGELLIYIYVCVCVRARARARVRVRACVYTYLLTYLLTYSMVQDIL